MCGRCWGCLEARLAPRTSGGMVHVAAQLPVRTVKSDPRMRDATGDSARRAPPRARPPRGFFPGPAKCISERAWGRPPFPPLCGAYSSSCQSHREQDGDVTDAAQSSEEPPRSAGRGFCAVLTPRGPRRPGPVAVSFTNEKGRRSEELDAVPRHAASRWPGRDAHPRLERSSLFPTFAWA